MEEWKFYLFYFILYIYVKSTQISLKTFSYLLEIALTVFEASLFSKLIILRQIFFSKMKFCVFINKKIRCVHLFYDTFRWENILNTFICIYFINWRFLFPLKKKKRIVYIDFIWRCMEVFYLYFCAFSKQINIYVVQFQEILVNIIL